MLLDVTKIREPQLRIDRTDEPSDNHTKGRNALYSGSDPGSDWSLDLGLDPATCGLRRGRPSLTPD